MAAGGQSVAADGTGEKKRQANTEVRIAYVMQLMRTLKFRRGATTRRLMQDWGLSESMVSQITAEASKRISKEFGDPTRHVGKMALVLDEVMDDALRLMKGAEIHQESAEGVRVLKFDPTRAHNSVIQAARALAHLTGANAAIRVELAQSDATKEELRELGELALTLSKEEDE